MDEAENPLSLIEKYKSSSGDEIPERDMTYHLI